jgi:hypothetical protein
MYSIDDIKDAWTKYRETKVMAVLKGGEWTYFNLDNRPKRIDGTSAALKPIKEFMTFPEFLEEECKK